MLQQKRFRVYRRLYEESAKAAQTDSVGLPMTQYSRQAILLLGFVSRSGFTTTDTTLRGPSSQTITIPKLKTPDSQTHRQKRDLFTNLTPEEVADVAYLADKVGISANERVCRALRLANFLVEHSVFNQPVFQRHGEITHVLLSP